MSFDISRQEAELLGLVPKTKEYRKNRPAQEHQEVSRPGTNRKTQTEPSKDGQGKEEKEKATQAQILISLAGDAELFHTPEGECYATLTVAGHYENWPIKSKQFRRWLLRKFYESQGKPPGTQALQDALGVLEAKAQFDGPELPVHVRLAEAEGKIYIDLGNEAWETVEVSPGGWRTITDPPVKFRRTKGMLPLPTPEKGGNIKYLRPFINVPDEAGGG